MKGQEFLTTEKGYLNIPESEFKLTMKELSDLLDEFAVKLFAIPCVVVRSEQLKTQQEVYDSGYNDKASEDDMIC